MGQALARLLASLGETTAERWTAHAACPFAAMFALACARWGIAPLDGAGALTWSWAENQVASAVKLVPLGQTSAQRILFDVGPRIEAACLHGLDLPDDDIGGSALGLCIASSLHETQHTRLFRS